MKKTVALLALFAAAASHAGECFVSPAGDDANPGTRRQPFATLVRARDAIRAAKQAGDTAAWTVRTDEQKQGI